METHRSPSVFNLLSSDNLKSGLREAIRYLLENLNNISSFRRLPLPRTDETVLIIDLLIEYSHLRSYKASYAENLFNLIRVRRSTGVAEPNLAHSIACLVLFPYLRRKIDKYFEELNYKPVRTADELRRIRLYRLLTRSCTFLNLICLARYAAGKATYHNVIDGLIDSSLVSRGLEFNSETEHSSSLDETTKAIADILGRALTIGSYVIQFLDHWNTHSNSAPLFSASLPVPEAPKRSELTYSDERSSNICLICSHVRQNECALSNTGYVFCYSCLQRFVTAEQRCPVTGHPATVDNFVKLFTTSTPS